LSSFSIPAPEPFPNPFDDFTEAELYGMQIAITYGCLRSKTDERQPHHKYICSLQRIIDDEATKRGYKKPVFPHPPPA